MLVQHRAAFLRIVFQFFAVVLTCSSVAIAEELRETRKIAAKVDSLIEAKLIAEKVPPAKPADDVEFLRRVYIDLSGSVPTREQAAKFLDDTSEDKRQKLVDELLASPRFGEQFGRVWRDWIAPAELPSEGNGGNQPIEATRNLAKWFAARLNADEPWNEIVRQVLDVDGNLKEHPQGLFYSLVGTDEGIPEPAGITRAVSSLFMGVQLQCAECHNDPFKSWKQEEFWGMAAYFRNVESTFNGRYFDSVTETFTKDGKPLVKTKGKPKPTQNDKSPNGAITIPPTAFVNTGTVVSGRLVDGNLLEAKEEEPLRPKFTSWLLEKENPYFARAFVNRAWAYLFARGLVHPVDDMRPDNPASHPELLDLLAREFTESGYNVKHVFRCLVNSQTYQRTSRPTGKPDAKGVELFGRHPVKVMSPDQLYDSLKLALAEPKLDLRPVGTKVTGESSPNGDEYQEFARLFETNEEDATDFIHGIPQSLALLNHPRVVSGGKAIEALLKEKVEPEAAIERMYLSTLSRRPTEVEAREALDYISVVEDRQTAFAGVLWSLVNRSEYLLVR